MQVQHDLQDVLPVERDETFYYASGDCIIRVQQTLFKVHTFQLVNNSPVFASLFALPLGEAKKEGLSDDLPIVFQGDTASDFRSLLKYIYASVIATQIPSIPLSELPHVIGVARLAHKYEMEAWQKWAFLFFASHFKTLSTKNLTHSDLAAMYKLCDKAQWLTLRAEIVNLWIQKIESEPVPRLSEALDAAELRSDRTFLTRLYTLHILHTRDLSTLANPTPFPTDGIPPVHLTRMLMGHWSLSASWSHFRSSPPTFPPYLMYCTPEKHDACIQTVTAFWDQALANAEREYPISQIAARLERVRRAMADALPKWRCFDAFIGSGNGAVDPFQKTVDGFRLEDHFFPPPPPSGTMTA